MEAIVGVVVPPFAILIDKFTLAFEEVSMVLVFPSYTGSIVSKGSIGRIPIRNDATVAAKRTEIHDCNGTHWVKPRCIDGLIQSRMDAYFWTCIGQPSNRVGIVGTGQGPLCPVRSVEYGLIIKPSIRPSSRYLFIVCEEQLPSVLR